MYTYTLNKNIEDTLFLLNQQQQQFPVAHLLSLYPAARVFAFDAPMGTGKTTLIRQLCREMGSNDIVNSPTFAIVNVYDIPNAPFPTPDNTIYHFDCYRLKDLREAVDFGAEEYLYSGNFCFIEWPNIILPLLPDNTVFIQMKQLPDGTRTLTIQQQ